MGAGRIRNFAYLYFILQHIKGGIIMWTACVFNNDATIKDIMEIIDDALANGFEFKVENHILYFREIEY